MCLIREPDGIRLYSVYWLQLYELSLSFLKRSRVKPNLQGKTARALEGWPWVLSLSPDAKWLASTLNSRSAQPCKKQHSYPVQMDTVVFINHSFCRAIQRRMFRCHCAGSTGCFDQFHLRFSGLCRSGCLIAWTVTSIQLIVSATDKPIDVILL